VLVGGKGVNGGWCVMGWAVQMCMQIIWWAWCREGPHLLLRQGCSPRVVNKCVSPMIAVFSELMEGVVQKRVTIQAALYSVSGAADT
jgi:hypothetical protein